MRAKAALIAVTLMGATPLAAADLDTATLDAAFKQLTKEAGNGDTNAQYNLGRMYEAGIGVEKDLIEAHKWLSISANAGQADAAPLRDALEYKMGHDAIDEARSRAAAFAPAPTGGGLPTLNLPKLTLPGVAGAEPTGQTNETAVAALPPTAVEVEEPTQDKFASPPSLDEVFDDMTAAFRQIERSMQPYNTWALASPFRNAPSMHDKVKRVLNVSGSEDGIVSGLLKLGEADPAITWIRRNERQITASGGYNARGIYSTTVTELIEVGRYDEAEDLIDDAPYFKMDFNWDTLETELRYWAGGAFARLGQFERAEKQFNKMGSHTLERGPKEMLAQGRFTFEKRTDISELISAGLVDASDATGYLYKPLRDHDMDKVNAMLPAILQLIDKEFANPRKLTSTWFVAKVGEALARNDDAAGFRRIAEACLTLARSLPKDDYNAPTAIKFAMTYFTAAGDENRAAELQSMLDESNNDDVPSHIALGHVFRRDFDAWIASFEGGGMSDYNVQIAVEYAARLGEPGLALQVVDRIKAPEQRLMALGAIATELLRRDNKDEWAHL